MPESNGVLILESTHLIKTNKWKCEKIFKEGNFSENNIIDILISLHLIMEIGINGLFRVMSHPTFKKDVDILDRMEKIDKINFIDKVTMFIYFGNFDFTDTKYFKNRLEDATKYHKIIGTLKNFAEIRNSLLHGHSLGIVHNLDMSNKRNTKTQEKLNEDFLKKQIKKFKFIMNGIGFYLDCYDKERIPIDTKAGWFGAYLETNFLYHYVEKHKEEFRLL